MTSDLRFRLSEIYAPDPNDSDDVWQLRAAEAVLAHSIPGCIDGSELGLPDGWPGMLAWVKTKKLLNDKVYVDARGNLITAEIGQRMIDALVAAGHSRADFRWRISVNQRRQLTKYLRMIAPLETLRREVEYGAGEEGGMFLGVPYVIDPDLREDSVVLEVVREAERIGMIHGLGVDR